MSTAVTTTGQPSHELAISPEQVDLLKRTICKGSTDDELAMFLQASQRLGLDPFSKQIHAVKRYDSQERREVMTIQVGIDGFRLAAERSGRYAGQEGTWWCGPDGEWREVWNSPENPIAAKTVVLLHGRSGVVRVPAVAHWREYVATKRDGSPMAMWKTKGALMLAKCSEALALRKAFPAELSGMYSPDEMAQAANTAAPVEPIGPPPVAPLEPVDDREVVARLRDAVKAHGMNAAQVGAVLDGLGVPAMDPLKKRIAMAPDDVLERAVHQITDEPVDAEVVQQGGHE